MCLSSGMMLQENYDMALQGGRLELAPRETEATIILIILEQRLLQ